MLLHCYVFPGLPWSALHIEKCAKEVLVVFLLILAAFADLCQFSRALLFLLDHVAATESCLVFAFEVDCWYLDNKEWNHPKEILLNRSTTPLYY